MELIDALGLDLTDKATLKAVCPVCGRTVATCKFAVHAVRCGIITFADHMAIQDEAVAASNSAGVVQGDDDGSFVVD